MTFDGIWWLLLAFDDFWWHLMTFVGIWWLLLAFDDLPPHRRELEDLLEEDEVFILISNLISITFISICVWLRCASPSLPSPAWAARDSQCRKQSLILRTPLQGCYHHHCIELDKFDWIFCFAMAATLRSLFWPSEATFLGHPRFARSHSKDKRQRKAVRNQKWCFSYTL